MLIVTATTILNGSLERILDRVGNAVRVLILGPSTPMVPTAHRFLQVDMLGGMVPLHNDRVMAAVRQGAGTPELTPFCRKVVCAVEPLADP